MATVTETMKKCSKCENEFPLYNFYKHRVNKSGLQLYKGRCKNCCKSTTEKNKEYCATYRAKNREHLNKIRSECYYKKKLTKTDVIYNEMIEQYKKQSIN